MIENNEWSWLRMSLWFEDAKGILISIPDGGFDVLFFDIRVELVQFFCYGRLLSYPTDSCIFV